LGITDSDELDRAEAFWTASQLAQLHRRDGLRIEGSYDLSHLQTFHRFLFGEIYARYWTTTSRRPSPTTTETPDLPTQRRGYRL